jgi:hypothetical protein
MLRKANGEFAGYANADALRQITEAEYSAAIAPKDPRDAFVKGDKVRLVSGAGKSGLYGFTEGNIYTVNNPETTQWESKRIGIEGADNYGYALPEQLVKLTAEDVAAIEKEAQETAKWAAIGRKVGELKDGDVVQFTQSTGASEFPTGSVAVIHNVRGIRFNFDVYEGLAQWVTLITPVEQRFDTAA